MPDELDEPLDVEFPEVEDQTEHVLEPESGEQEEYLEPESGEPAAWEYSPMLDDPVDPSDALREQVDLELIETSPDAQEVFQAPEYPPQEVPQAPSQESGGVLFLPTNDPIRQPVMPNPLDPRLVYTRPVSRRLLHLTLERKLPEYPRPGPDLLQPRG